MGMRERAIPYSMPGGGRQMRSVSYGPVSTR